MPAERILTSSWAAARVLAATATLALLAATRLAAETPATITEPVQIWAMPSAEKALEHPLRLEGRVNYYDPLWKMLWLESGGASTYIQLTAPIPPLATGQRVAIEGAIVPQRGLEPDRVTVRVLRDFEPVEPLPTQGRINDMVALASRIVTVDAYVDGQQLIDADHVRLALIVENRPVIGWVKPDDPNNLPNWQGRFVRATGLYSGRFDPTGTQTTIELWLDRQANLTVLGGIDGYPLFTIPRTPIAEIYRLPPGTQVRVAGQVENHDTGNLLIVRDDTGQIAIRSIQRQRFAPEAPVEVVGRVAVDGPRWMLDQALYRRPPAGTAALTETSEEDGVIRGIERIRQLGADEAAQGRLVRLTGMVSWSLPESDIFFLQDVGGGVRVHFDRAKFGAPPLLKYLRIEGVTARGVFAPTVELRQFDDLGAMSSPDAKPVTLEQAMTGREEGQWVQLRGFLRTVTSEGDWRWIHVTNPAGEFVAHLQSPVNFVANPGTLIRVRGVCETVADAHGRATGVTLRVPFLHDIAVEDNAPGDPFGLPLRSIAGVSQLGSSQAMMRVRVAGVVTHSVPGRLVYLQDNEAGMLVFTREKLALVPGDRVEAVGILGREGVRTILRETVFLKTGSGPAPVPAPLVSPASAAYELDSRLVRVRGTLIDTLHRPGFTRLSLQSGGTLFEAVIDGVGAPPPMAVGAGLELTGIYRLVFDDARESRGFRVLLRSAGDAVVYQPARIWTLRRALIACGVLAAVMLLGIAWITALRRRVSQQTRQIREQVERQARLEAEVQRAARLESLGTLAGGIAHDFNNALTVVFGNVSLAQTDDKAVEHAGEYLREIERGARRARELTQQLLTFAKGGDPLRSAVALPEIVRQATALVLHGTNVRCEYAIALDLWPAHVDRDQIAQAVQNLALNAIQAMPQGGTLRVTLANEDIAAGAKPGLAAGRYVSLAMSDTGDGIAPDVLPRIFDPYFTTKKKGSGLGLATVYSIVRKHQGRIEAESILGHGTTFRLWLPTAAEAESAPAPAAPKPELAPAGAPPAAYKSKALPRVLAMDDEESIRRVLDLVLRRMNLDPCIVADGAAAIREFQAARDAGRPYDLLILDLTIPGGMGGRKVMEIIRQTDPFTPAIVSSGYSNDPILANYAEFGFQAVVPKPYDVRQFGSVVRQLVSSAKSVAAGP